MYYSFCLNFNFVVKHIYQYGYLKEIRRAENDSLIWKWETVNDKGIINSFSLGNGLITTFGFNSNNQLESIKTGTTANPITVQNLAYTYNSLGLMTSRSNLNKTLTENFEYDKLERLTKNYNQQAITYNNMGNIISKTDVGTYEYEQDVTPAIYQPNAVKNIYYPAAGFAPNNLTLTYTSFNKIKQITNSSTNTTLNLEYTYDQQRCKTIQKLGTQTTKTKYFVNNLYEKEVNTDGSFRELLYIYGGNGLAAIYEKKSNNTTNMLYVHTDHLGSLETLTNKFGNTFKNFSFDAWGRRRNPNDWTFNNVPTPYIDKGYTMHEHLDAFAIINMNGRVYDPILGRFLSPDPYVQAPDNSQNFNRYSYCLNNPMKYTDPSGEFFWIPIIAGAIIYGTVNTIIHHNRGDIHNFWDGAGYFVQGAVVGAVAGATWSTGFAGIASTNIWAQIGGYTILGAKTVSAITTISSSINNIENAGKILMGRAYTDENRSFVGAMLKGISRNTWEAPQTWIGYNYTQLRNTFGKVDEVEYWGGATFAIDENVTNFHGWRGVSLGNYINAQLDRQLDRDFAGGWIYSEGGLFWHEYGHTTDSQLFGLFYMLAIGLPSAAGAEWTERRANNHAWHYADKYNFMDTWMYPVRFPLR